MKNILSRIRRPNGLLVLLAAPLVLWSLLPAGAVTETSNPSTLAPDGTDAAGDPPGQIAFEAAKCTLCHEVSSLGIERKSKSEKMQGRDMTGIGEGFDREFAAAYIRQEETLDGEKHKKPFKGTDEELEAILDWLAIL